MLQGAGDKAFASGTDINQFREFKTPQHALEYEARIDRVLTFNLLPLGQFPAARASAIGANLWQRLNELPGVESASAVSMLPISGSLWTRGVQVDGYNVPNSDEETVRFNVIAPSSCDSHAPPISA